MSYPTYTAKGTKSDAINVASVTPTYPVTTAGDLIFVIVVIEDTTGGVESPSGFSNLASETNIYTNVHTYIFYKYADGLESGTLTVDAAGESGGAADYMFAQIYLVSGANPKIEDAVSEKGSGDTVLWDTATVGDTERTLLALVVDWDGTGGPATPTGYTQNATDSSSAISGMTVELYSKENTASGASMTSTGGSVNGWGTFHISTFDQIMYPGTGVLTLTGFAPSFSTGTPSAGTRSFIVN